MAEDPVADVRSVILVNGLKLMGRAIKVGPPQVTR
jgi:hypothetical protein